MSALPHPAWRLPLLGDLLRFRLTTPAQSMNAIGAGLGPVFEFRALGARYVIVQGADAIAELNDETRFGKFVGPDIDALREAGGDGLFTAHDDEPNWQRAHDLLMPAFSQSAMRRHHGVMLDVTAELLAHWDTAAASGAPIDVAADTTRVTLETIGRVAADYSFGGPGASRAHPFVGHMVGALTAADRVGAARESFAPAVVERLLRSRLRRHSRALHAIADDAIARRRAVGAAERLADGPDLLDLMLDGGLGLANIRYQLINLLIAGHETTSGALSFALYHLAGHPEAFARARAEADEVWAGAARPDFERVAKLRYLRRVFDETLRLHPTVPGYYRRARADTVLAGRHPMRAGDWALVLTWSLSRDPRWGPDPERFDPDRFAPERVRSRPAGLYKPFGTGPRSCIGRQFALHEAILVLGAIVARYDLIPDPDYRLVVSERLTLMPRGFRLRLRRRDA